MKLLDITGEMTDNIVMKKCTKCHAEKPLDRYSPNKATKDRRASWCKACNCELVKNLRLQNDAVRYKGQREDVREYQRLYREKNKEIMAERDREYAKKNAEKIRAYSAAWRMDNRGKLLEDKKAYHRENIDRMRPRKREYERQRRESDPMYRLTKAFAHRIRESLKSGKNGAPWELLVGYNLSCLKIHLEKQFKPGMSWDNYGEWHVDHRTPIAAHHYEKPTDIDFRKAWELKNLRPMWAHDNMSKGARLDHPFQPSLAMAV